MKTLKRLYAIILFSEIVFSQSIVIGTGSSIDVGAGSDICAGVYGNIQGNLTGSGTQCNQTMVQTFQLSVTVANGWNLVSVPGLNSPDQNVNTWWPYRDSTASVYKYMGGYQVVNSVIPGDGYWMKHAGARTYNTGDEWPAAGIQIVQHDTLNGFSGWNIIGGYEIIVSANNITTIPPGRQSGPIYYYSGGYNVASTIEPGYGYWIKLTGDAQIIIPETIAKEVNHKEWFPEDWGKIVFVDAEGKSYVLYCAKDGTDLTNYELPPSPPAGVFDIRYETGRIAEKINEARKLIELNGVQYPLVIKVEGIDIKLTDETGKVIKLNLKTGEEIVINDATVKKLGVSTVEIPEEYSLEQNYPNPFNPSTTISWQSPVGSRQTLKVYDILGNEVATLVDEYREAGRYEVEFNASQLSSGIYFYKLTAGSFSQTKKMTIIK